MGCCIVTKVGIRFSLVQYKGLPPALTDVVAGHIDMMFHELASTLPHIKAGKLKAIGIGGEVRIPELPGVPTISETYPGFLTTSWYAVVAPPKTQPEIADKLSQALAEALRHPDVATRLKQDSSTTPVGSSPAETAAFLKQESERWRQVIVPAGIKRE